MTCRPEEEQMGPRDEDSTDLLGTVDKPKPPEPHSRNRQSSSEEKSAENRDKEIDTHVPDNAATGTNGSTDRKLAPWLQRVPNTAFGIALGLGGHSILWKTVGVAFLNSLFFWAEILVLVAVTIIYLVKAWNYPTLIHTEWAHPVRTHFFNCPHIAILMLAIGSPPSYASMALLRTLWTFCAAVQTFLTRVIYTRWMFGKRSNIGEARAPFLLSTVGWLLLALLGQQTDLHAASGLNLPAFCFGAGTFLYCLVVVSMFLAMHTVRKHSAGPYFHAYAFNSVCGGGLHGVPIYLTRWCDLVWRRRLPRRGLHRCSYS